MKDFLKLNDSLVINLRHVVSVTVRPTYAVIKCANGEVNEITPEHDKEAFEALSRFVSEWQS